MHIKYYTPFHQDAFVLNAVIVLVTVHLTLHNSVLQGGERVLLMDRWNSSPLGYLRTPALIKMANVTACLLSSIIMYYISFSPLRLQSTFFISDRCVMTARFTQLRLVFALFFSMKSLSALLQIHVCEYDENVYLRKLRVCLLNQSLRFFRLVNDHTVHFPILTNLLYQI